MISITAICRPVNSNTPHQATRPSHTMLVECCELTETTTIITLSNWVFVTLSRCSQCACTAVIGTISSIFRVRKTFYSSFTVLLLCTFFIFLLYLLGFLIFPHFLHVHIFLTFFLFYSSSEVNFSPHLLLFQLSSSPRSHTAKLHGESPADYNRPPSWCHWQKNPAFIPFIRLHFNLRDDKERRISA